MNCAHDVALILELVRYILGDNNFLIWNNAADTVKKVS
jgi:hypothetical protein